MYNDPWNAEYKAQLKEGRRLFAWALFLFAWALFLAALVIVIVGSQLYVLADTARIDFPDGTKDCTFQALNVSPSNTTLTVSGCYLGGTVEQPPPPSVSGDPGSGVWVTPTGVAVFDLSPNSNRTFIPGCIRGENWVTTNCEYDGSLKFGQTYAARVKIPRSGQMNLKFDRAETGEADGGSGVRGALSSIPGDIQTGSPACVFGALDPYITVIDQAVATATVDFCSLLPPELRNGCRPIEPACAVAADTTYYLNFTPTLASCGGGSECRVQLIVN